LVRNLTAGEERRLFVETVLAGVDRLDWLKVALVRQTDPARDRGAGEQFRNRLMEEVLHFCPVVGHRLNPGRVFCGWGNDARAKAVINGLLSDVPAYRMMAESRLERWDNPAAAYMAVAICHDRGMGARHHC